MRITRVLVACVLLSWQLLAQAERPIISIIIDDLGNHARDEAAVNLPGAVACSFLPHTPHAHRLAVLAHSRNKEVMLHAPMEALHHNNKLGPGSLRLDMTEHEFIRTLQEDIAAVPHVKGINNHMGSLLTQHPGHMLWLMREMNRHGDLFFVDSRTTSRSVALMVANENHVPHLTRDVFLDAEPGAAFVEQQFDRLLKIARKHGSALGIAHPYPETMNVLKQRLEQLEHEQINLVPVSTLIKVRAQRSDPWQVSLYH